MSGIGERYSKKTDKEINGMGILLFSGMIISGILTYLVSLTKDITEYWFMIFLGFYSVCIIIIFLMGVHYNNKFYEKEYLYAVKYNGMKDGLNRKEKLEKKFANDTDVLDTMLEYEKAELKKSKNKLNEVKKIGDKLKED